MRHIITWRDKPVQTPAGKTLAVSHAKLAEALQAEWDKWGKWDNDKADKNARPPLTVLAASVIDVIAENRPQIETAAFAYIDADVLCYFADEPDALIDYQHKKWDAWLAWIETELQAAPKTASGIRPVRQSPQYRKAAEAILRQADDWHFYALQNFITASRSFILGLSLYKNQLTASEAIELSDADALYQEQSWGSDSQVLQDRKKLENEITEVQNYLLLLKD